MNKNGIFFKKQQNMHTTNRISTVGLLGVPFICLVLTSCYEETAPAAQPNASANSVKKGPNKAMNQDQLNFTAQVKYVDLEGGFFALYAEDGKIYQPTSLKKEFRQNGLVVKIQARIADDMVSFQQHGQLIHLLKVVIVDDSKVTPVGNDY